MNRTTTRARLRGALLAVALGAAALPFVPSTAHAAHDVVVSPVPDQSAPRVTNGRVYAIDTHGPLVAVGGSFTTIRPGGGGADIPRQWLFMYNRDTGQISQTFVPQLSGPAPAPTIGYVKDQPGVEAVQFAPDGQSLYVGGWFTNVNGQTRNRIVQLNLDGSVRGSFNATVNNNVLDMALVGDRLIVGGRFTQVNGKAVHRLVSLNPATGATQTDFDLQATESRNQWGAYVSEMDASPNGRWLAVSGSFRKVGTAARNQLALIDLQGTPSVANWSTDVYAPNCSQSSTDSGSYIRGVAFSPDSSYFVVSTTGAFVGADTMCDTAARWEAPPTAFGDGVAWTWRAKTGGDTLWASHVTESAVYVGGHQRWMNNPRPSPGGDNDGPGSVQRYGIAALDPLTGVPLSWNPGRDRGRGAEAIVSDDQYLYVGHDTDLWGGAVRQRLAQLPVAGGTANPQPVDAKLPVNLYVTDGSTLRRTRFDGAAFGAVSDVSGPGIDGESWSTNRGGFVQAGKLHYFGASQAFYSRPFSDTSIGAPTNLSTSVGYVDTNYNLTPYDQPYGVAETTAATYHQGRIYYVKSGDSRLHQRGYSLQSGIIEGTEYVASTASYSSVRAMAFIGDWLYTAESDGRLYRTYAPKGRVDAGSRALVDNGASVDWEDARGLWTTPADGSAQEPNPPAGQNCSGATPWKAEYWSNTNLEGSPVTTRCEAAIDYDYGSGSPSGTPVGSDNFSIRWTRSLEVAERASLRIDATTDDGVRAYVDGQRVIDSWIDTAPVLRTGTSDALEPGTHTVRVEYYERGGGAVARVQTTLVDPPPVDPGPDVTAPPAPTATSPAKGSTVASASVSGSGTATDDRSVREVRVAVYNRSNASAPWLQADGTWGTRYAYRTATLGTPDAASTGWGFGVDLANGLYAFDVKTVDLAGNISPSLWHPFVVSAPTANRVAPTVTTSAPTVKGRTATLTGAASDDQGVSTVLVAVSRKGATPSTRWLQANGSFGDREVYRLARLVRPGRKATDWRLALQLPRGRYVATVVSLDRTGTLQRRPATRIVTVR